MITGLHLCRDLQGDIATNAHLLVKFASWHLFAIEACGPFEISKGLKYSRKNSASLQKKI